MTTTAVGSEQIPCPTCYVSYTDLTGSPWLVGAMLVISGVFAVVGAIGLLWTCLVDDDNAAISQAAARQSRKQYLGMTVGAVIVGAATALLETVQGVSLGGLWWALGSAWVLTAAIVAAAVVVDARRSTRTASAEPVDDGATNGQARS